MNTKIREATIKDVDKGLLSVFIEGYRYHQNGRPDVFTNISDEVLKEDLINNLNRLSTIVIFDGDTIVGYLSYLIKGNHSKKLHVDQLIISENYRGKGLGKKLMDEVKNIALKNNCDRIELDCWMFNKSAIAMYEHIGFDRQRIMFELPLKINEDKHVEKFYLERPSLKRKDELIQYFDEFVQYNSDINGSGSLDKMLEGFTFEQALDRCLNMENEGFAKKMGRCPGKTFLLIRKNDNKIIGTINVRWNLTEAMKKFGGNIGYGIRPTERRKGYNKINLYLGLLEAQKLGLDRVMLDCDVNNLGSDRTMKSLGGVLERTEIDPYDGILTNVYWFDVDNCINKYKSVYEPFINLND